jgi:hypothetical protein
MPILVFNIQYPYNVITKIIYVKYISKARYKMNRSMNKTHTIQFTLFVLLDFLVEMLQLPFYFQLQYITYTNNNNGNDK